MKHFEYTPSGVCSRQIIFDLTDDNKIVNLHYIGGCDGNLKAISKLCEGQDAAKICSKAIYVEIKKLAVLINLQKH